MTRQIVLDTETTGLNRCNKKNPHDYRTWVSYRHRVIEIGALEMIDNTLTGRKFHTYLNPLTKISDEAIGIHGILETDLQGSPQFSDICDEFLDFVVGSTLIIHNSDFDMEFLDQELMIYDRMPPIQRFLNPKKPFICTREMSGGLSLDDLCAKYGIDTSNRKLHGALLDAELLASAYMAMIGKGDGPRVLRSSVNECLNYYYKKYHEKPEGVLIQEIKSKLENLI